MKIFALLRDQFQKDGGSYLAYLNRIGDFPNFELLTPECLLSKKKKAPLKILDLACGPGNAGDYLARKLSRRFSIEKVIYVDINADRLKTIPNSLIPREIVKSDLFDFLAKTGERYDVVVLRYAIYYFPLAEQNRLLEVVASAMPKGGCCVVSSFGLNDGETGFLTELNAKAMVFKSIHYDGCYVPPKDLKNRMKVRGFLKFELSKGITVWDIESFSKKFNLNKNQYGELKSWAASKCEELGLSFKEENDNLYFEVPVYVLKGIKA